MTTQALPHLMTDQLCMDRLNQGDLHGIAPLFGRHHHRVHSAAVTLAGSHQADALVGEAFGRLLLLLLDGERPEIAVRYFLYASLRQSQREHRAVALLGPAAATYTTLPSNWRELLRFAAAEHLVEEAGVGLIPLNQMYLCRSAEIVRQITAKNGRACVTRPRQGGQARG